jgi:transcriptional regulator with XRE-family HTH domain
MVKQEHPLRTWRNGAELTLDDVARRAGTTKETISRIELWVRSPSLSLAKKLSEVSGLPLEEVAKSKDEVGQ